MFLPLTLKGLGKCLNLTYTTGFVLLLASTSKGHLLKYGN